MSGVLTKSEHEASLRCLRALRVPVCATTVLTWGPDETSAYVRLSRAGYVGEVEERAPTKPTAPFRWSRIAATPAGLEYLRQIESVA
jgi:hypothetical protein